MTLLRSTLNTTENKEENMKVKDKVKDIIDAQQDKGLSKYGVYVDDADLTAEEWIEHAQEELADMMVYLECLKRKISKRLIDILDD